MYSEKGGIYSSCAEWDAGSEVKGGTPEGDWCLSVVLSI
jgi:hypothetical protein